MTSTQYFGKESEDTKIGHFFISFFAAKITHEHNSMNNLIMDEMLHNGKAY